MDEASGEALRRRIFIPLDEFTDGSGALISQDQLPAHMQPGVKHDLDSLNHTLDSLEGSQPED